MNLIDIGFNYTHQSFRKDEQAVLERAKASGVTTMIITGTSVATSQRALALASEHPGLLYSTAGVHPHDAKTCDDDTIPTLTALYRQAPVVAIGETGLDFNRNYSPPADQERWLQEQLQLACELGAPVFLHERDAHGRFSAILRDFRDRLVAGVVHCFTGSAAELRAYLDLDLHIGITGWICDERRGQHLQELVAEVPANRLMLETDAPFLLPRDLEPRPKGWRNEPAYLRHIARTVARCRAQSVSELTNAVATTTRRFFGIEHISRTQSSEP